jgi:hypothetical protein
VQRALLPPTARSNQPRAISEGREPQKHHRDAAPGHGRLASVGVPVLRVSRFFLACAGSGAVGSGV